MITLKAEKRNPNVKAKKLRREGYVTGILSGKEMKEPVALQFDAAEAAKFIKANKEGTQIYLDIEGEKVDALVKNIDYNPIEKQLSAASTAFSSRFPKSRQKSVSSIPVFSGASTWH